MAATQVPTLIAVSDPVHSASVATLLMQAGAAVSMLQLRSAEDLVDRLEQELPSLLIVELDRDARALEQVRTRYPDLPTVVLLTNPTEELAFAISRLNAEDVWTLPVHPASMMERAEAVLQPLRAADDPLGDNMFPYPIDRPLMDRPLSDAAISDEHQTAKPGKSPPFMMGDNPRMAEIRDTIQKVSGTDVTVLIRGESGVGKEVVANLLFEHSRRRHKPFVKVNCAAIPHDLLESELFGYEAGAFTGAVRSKPGKFELADHGTLFLDEIAEMHPSLQAKLLHVLQDGKFSRLGAKRDVSVDVRIVCATNKLLEERVREGSFREDLLYRINVVTISLPPLRERRDEIPVLTDFLLAKYSAQYGRKLAPLSPEVIQRMRQYDWPGNIRELENLCKRFVLVGSETQILRELSQRPGTMPDSSRPALAKNAANAAEPVETGEAAPATLSLLEVGRRAAWEAERAAILETLEATRWNRREASRRLQVSYKALLNKIKSMGLDDQIPPQSTP